ncbi:pyridoxine 5'-phosphate synthase [Deltaproteobacteria bacterium]|nr:pyridoxine 5'-phosphate synthase [Deltaproteobacteria bacterium]
MIRRLGVNVDHVATLRQARQAAYPDPLAAALIAERAGASQITVHIRGDRRHIQDHDLRRMRESVQTLLNVEAACTEEMAEILLKVRPHRVTLVAERPGEVTTEGGLDVAGQGAEVAAFARRLAAAGIHVALFIDPDDHQVDASPVAGVDMVELNTARWSETGDRRELARLARATNRARALGLSVAAGHGLNLQNLRELVAAAPEIEEYNIGHALIGDAVFLGLETSVMRYLALVVG